VYCIDLAPLSLPPLSIERLLGEEQRKMKEQIKKNEAEKTYKVRLLREINNKLIDIKTVRKSTIEKYNIKLDEKTNKYISE